MQIEDVAKCCHEANKALCEGLGDFSQKKMGNRGRMAKRLRY